MPPDYRKSDLRWVGHRGLRGSTTAVDLTVLCARCRVNAVCPGPIMTEATQRHADSQGKPLEDICREMTDLLILKR